MGSLTVRLPNSTHEQLKRLSKDEGVSIHQLVRIGRHWETLTVACSK